MTGGLAVCVRKRLASMRAREPRRYTIDYNVGRRGRNGSRTSGLGFCACHAITDEAVAKAQSPTQFGSKQWMTVVG
jgi:hypothetical protein